MTFIIIGLIAVATFVVLIVRQRTGSSKSTTVNKKSSAALQEFLPIERFHPSGAVVVNGQFRQLIHVGDLNLFSMALEEIQAVRERFKEMLMRLDNPFQISVQARRANYTDFVQYAEATIQETVKSYQNPQLAEYAESLQAYLKEESLKPRTDRENLIVIGVMPKVGGEDEQSQLERLDHEQAYVEAGLQSMGVPYQTLGPIEVVEAVQNFWSRERAVSQRYRDAVRLRTHAPLIDGADVEVTYVARS